jgi:hypothetical protein
VVVVVMLLLLRVQPLELVLSPLLLPWMLLVAQLLALVPLLSQLLLLLLHPKLQQSPPQHPHHATHAPCPSLQAL